MPDHAPTATPVRTELHRIEVHPAPDRPDPRAESLVREAKQIGLPLRAARAARVYFLEGPLDLHALNHVRRELLVSGVTEHDVDGASPTPAGWHTIEVHPLPGVMDPAAQSIREAIADLFAIRAEVSTGWRYDVSGLTRDEADALARRLLANPVVHAIHHGSWLPEALPRGRAYEFRLTHVPIRDLDDAALERMSRDAHLFLSLDEMRAIRDHYRAQQRDPSDIELETLAQTWSEHCVHKTLKSTITYRGPSDTNADPIDWSNRPGHERQPDGSVLIRNLLKSTVAAATRELTAPAPHGGGIDWTLSVFVDNSGVVALDDQNAVCIKVETHNHPSALEPYGGAATGIGGCIRDVIGTGLGAKPIASTDVFCVAPPDTRELPPGCLHPKRVLRDVVAGVRDYGNRMGIPTVNGAVYFDDRYVGNPLVFAGSIGVMPRNRIKGAARAGDLIVALGGRTGRDGIHGATFSSAELTDSHADEFAHAVQIGNAIEEKRVLDAILRARDVGPEPLYSGLTDCGAGGFSSAVGEMGATLGAEVHLDRAPLKYAGLSYTEIWISEAQERMVLAVPEANLAELERICNEERVELAVLGTFGTPNAELILHYHGHEVGRMSMHFLHEGIPMPTREAVWTPRTTAANARTPARPSDPAPSARDALLALLAHPNIASKHAIIRQYDHEVLGNTVVKPLVGPQLRGPSDAAVLEPVPGSERGIAIACGLQTSLGDPELGGDPYLMTLAAIDECVRNLVCVGADPDRVAILDNFCWPSCKKPENLATLVRAAEGCYDGAKAYRTPFVSGKDSLNNQLTIPEERLPDGSVRPARTIEIPPTLLITGLAIVPELSRVVTMDAKKPGSAILYVTGADPDSLRGLRGSHYAKRFDIAGLRTDEGDPVDHFPCADLARGPATARAVAELIARSARDPIAGCRVHATHDISDGGLLVALAEMLIAGSSPEAPLGASIAFQGAGPDASELFAEAPSSYLIEIDSPASDEAYEALLTHFERAGAYTEIIGDVNDTGVLDVMQSWGGRFDVPMEDLARAWRGTLD
ncbi:MAG: phosphoribosylformylglycinamidine synthase subunit PurS [Phycisphaerales bacterium]|jgi:phosphoribosylformylglycinamidine synthase|nr:phosphoribosylformylglycinamidine synthase subunit PurS [Phycisphaerales bacterium]